ncbi:UDP-glucose--hexose-1-phosphate uridylyltransferase [Sphingobacterium tabacisoli]|uniref:Galactose-1-phosphate uridylyltransferase n=1 Tax=Sphingobacterium tabacisoli TaxID=2044855 RepID=A0ABW5L8K4_9SPHI|nr:UDP-glucose--hexose-1-phosphate uridylyltransferase [Sphingobacterium tabacisoli]
MSFDLNNDPHIRIDILTGERVLVSPHRSKRPWQGQVEKSTTRERETYDEDCYLCPGNRRAEGAINPSYSGSFVFVNDFSALLDRDNSFYLNEKDLFITEAERGICKVISFSPRHDLTLAEMDLDAITQVVKTWQNEFDNLRKNIWVQYIQVFENKGAIMGCSNPHPHGQVWAQQGIPSAIVLEGQRQMDYFKKYGRTLLRDYLDAELKKKERVLIETKSFVCLVPYWAKWPFETMIISKRELQTISEFSSEELSDLALVIQELAIRYDNLFETSFPYSAGMHQAPVNTGDQSGWHWHMHFYPPLLRSATVKKFMVGYEMLADAQRDITPEKAAEMLQQLSVIHYKKQSNG